MNSVVIWVEAVLRGWRGWTLVALAWAVAIALMAWQVWV
jgi:hypothetical protein